MPGYLGDRPAGPMSSEGRDQGRQGQARRDQGKTGIEARVEIRRAASPVKSSLPPANSAISSSSPRIFPILPTTSSAPPPTASGRHANARSVTLNSGEHTEKTDIEETSGMTRKIRTDPEDRQQEILAKPAPDRHRSRQAS